MLRNRNPDGLDSDQTAEEAEQESWAEVDRWLDDAKDREEEVK
jgi:hypothetical protein